MSVNWYLGDGNYNYKLDPYPAIRQVQKVTETQGTKVEPRVASLLTHVDHLYQDLNKKQHQSSHEAFAVPARLIMSTPVVTLFMDTNKKDAIEYIRRFHYHHFPVVDQEEKIIGLITDRDFLRDAPSEKHHLDTDNKDENIEKITSIMSTKILIAGEDTCAREIGQIMLHEKIKCVPVIDHERKVKGIITSSDLIRCIIEHPSINDLG